VSGQQGYDTATILTRWLGKAARPSRDADTLLDAKMQKDGVGSSDKVTERANQATQFNEWRASGTGVRNRVIFHTQQGVFFQPGIDHEATTPPFGTARRPIIAPLALPPWVDGTGGLLPAVGLTSTRTWQGSDFANLALDGIQHVHRTLRPILKTVIAEVGMEKVQQHLDAQAKRQSNKQPGTVSTWPTPISSSISRC
jgi:hypothetical protein